MNIEIIKTAVYELETLNMPQKAVVNRALEMLSNERAMLNKLSKCIYKEETPIEYTKFDENLYIVELRTSDPKLYDDHSTYFQTVDLSKNRTIGEISYSLEEQMLFTMRYKYEGGNSRFAMYAKNMLVGK